MVRFAPFFLCALIALPFAAAAETLRALSSHSLSPMTRAESDADYPGFNVEVVRAIVAEAGHELDIVYMDSWADAQERAATEPGWLLFGPTRTEKREVKYDWVTPLVTVRHMIVSVGVPLSTLEAARDLGSLAATGSYYRRLDDKGFYQPCQAWPSRGFGGVDPRRCRSGLQCDRTGRLHLEPRIGS